MVRFDTIVTSLWFHGRIPRKCGVTLLVEHLLELNNLLHRLDIRCRSRWPRGLRRGSAIVRFLGLRVLIPPKSWMSVSCESCVLSGRGLCDGLITRPEESYRMWCAWVWSWSLDNEALAHWGLLRHEKNTTLDIPKCTRTAFLILILTPCKYISFAWSNLEERDGRGMQHVWRTGEVNIGFWWGNPRERAHLQNPGVDWKIIWRWIFFQEVEWRGKGGGGLDWIDLAQDRVSWQALVYAVMNLRVL